MKNGYLIIVVVLALSFLLVPLLAVEDKTSTGENSAAESANPSGAASESKSAAENEIKLYLSSEKNTVVVKTKEYIIGVVAAEMPAEYAEEALKAQTVAAYTYLCRKAQENSKAEYDITDDSNLDQGYISKEKREEKWGEKAKEYEAKITACVEAVFGKTITYDGEPILAAYHAISSGKTETANNMWGIDFPYLQAENSVGDLLAPEYLSEAVFTAEEFAQKLKALGAEASGDAESYIGESLKSESGTILKITLCGKEITGADVRSAFGLRSAAFELTYSAEKGFVFSVKGYGHGVGMSQFGANYMAQQGSSYDEIILAYYRGVKIS